ALPPHQAHARLLHGSRPHPHLASFPTRRSSDLHGIRIRDDALVSAAQLSDRYISDRFLPDKAIDLVDEAASGLKIQAESQPEQLDRKSTRLNSSHVKISYAVFCLKKKKQLKGEH